MRILKNCWFCMKTVFRYAPSNVIICFICYFVPGFFTGFQALLLQNITDHAIAFAKGTGEIRPLLLYGGLLVVMTALWSSMQHVATYQRDAISVKLIKRMAPDIAKRLMKLEYSAFEDRETHEIFQKMTNQPEQWVLECFFRTMIVGVQTISLIFTMGVFFYISPWIGIGVIVIGIPLVLLSYYTAGRRVVITEEVADVRRRIEDLKGLLTNKHVMFEMKLFGGDELFAQKWNYYGDKQESITIRENKKVVLMNVSSNLLRIIYMVFVLCMVAVGLLGGSFTPGQFTAAMSGACGMLDKLKHCAGHVSNFIEKAMGIEFYMDFLKMDTMDGTGIRTDQMELNYYDIAFENVSFQYPGTNREILKNVTFYVKEGERIAFVGENGAGKTTIIKLLCGLYEPTTGSITIGGVPVRELSEELRVKLLSVVFQDFGSFQLTLRENVAFGNLAALQDDEKLKGALRLAGAGELYESNEKGLDRNLGKLTEDGQDLSKGQWQRVAMARGFVSDAKYVILDEPTAALDPLAESRMYENFAKIFKDRGTIMISHRLASAKMADRILVLDGGRIVDSGSHEELMAKQSLYRTMFEMQSSFYNKDGEGQVAGA